MTFKCAICGAIVKKKQSLTTKRHLESKRHVTALNKGKSYLKEGRKNLSSSSEKQVAISSDIVLYLAISNINSPDINQILRFCSSFDIKTSDTLYSLKKRIGNGDIIYHHDFGVELDSLLKIFISKGKIDFPFTIKVQNFFKEFPNLKLNTHEQVIEYFLKMKSKYSEFINLSSSKLGYPVDLITINSLFPKHVHFKLNNRWARS